jgi:hypothetical protein
MRSAILGSVMAVAVFGTPALAHHSYAMFDAEKTLDLTGTVKEVQWENPHSWLQFLVKDKDGKVNEWSFEMGGAAGTGGPTGLSRQGFKIKDVVPGQKIVARIHPLRSGRFGGELISLIFSDGSMLGGREPIPRGESVSSSAKPIE